MISEKQRQKFDVKCHKCGKDITVSYSGYTANLRKNGGVGKFTCKECKYKDTAERNKKRAATMTEEEKKAIYSKVSEAMKKTWVNMDEKTKQERLDKVNEGSAKWRENVTDEEKERISKIHTESNKRRWEAMTDEEREQLSLDAKERWENKTDEEKKEWGKRSSDIWKNKSLKERYEWVNKIIRGGKTNNSLNKKFESYFQNSYISNDYYLNKEYQSSNKTVHIWDYAIFDKKNNELQMLVDLDGSFYHADKCDYDGIHSKEEYDESRGLSIPDGVKNVIIQEEIFSRSFEEMIKSLVSNYDEWINDLFRYFRLIPFPEPHYSDIELMKSYNSLKRMDCNDSVHYNLSLNTRVGDRLIQHFHPSIYKAHYKGEISPYIAWKDDDLLYRVIKNRVIYQNHLNPNKILQGFNVSKIAPKVSVFSAGRAKLIIYRYLSEFDEIFDPFAGFGGRMLGALSLGKSYIGQDLGLDHVNESINLIKFLKEKDPSTSASVTLANTLESSGQYQCLFTCPPYSDKEQWYDVPVDKRTCDDWIDVCLKNFKCKRYVFVVDETERYKNNIIDTITNRSYFNSNDEYVIVIDR